MKGDDVLIGGPGPDALNGGSGEDTCIGVRATDKPRSCERVR
jgi:Ca2+-binding RTX toxin-like protein